MNFSVQIKVMPLKELLDPQGKAVMGGLQNLGLSKVSDVRIGKNINLQVEADSAEQAKQIAEEASRKLLANPVMEYFEVSVKAILLAGIDIEPGQPVSSSAWKQECR